MHPLQHTLFDSTMTRKEFYKHCNWQGSGTIAFKPKSSVPETIKVKYDEVLKKLCTDTVLVQNQMGFQTCTFSL